MTYKYVSPEEYGFQYFKLSRKSHNEAMPHRKKNIFTKIDGYYSDKMIRIHYTTNTLGKVAITLFLPVAVVLNGLSSLGEIKREYIELWNEKEKGKFTTDYIQKIKGNGELSKYFKKLESVYNQQKKQD